MYIPEICINEFQNTTYPKDFVISRKLTTSDLTTCIHCICKSIFYDGKIEDDINFILQIIVFLSAALLVQ